MSTIDISIGNQKSILLDTAGKFCEQDILIRNEAYDAFWDAIQHNGNRLSYAFTFNSWPDEMYNPKYPIVCDGSSFYNGIDSNYAAWGVFAYSNIIDTKVPITITNTRADAVFDNCKELIIIRSLALNNVMRFSNTFRNCIALEEVNLTADSVIGASIPFAQSPLLTTASVDSIIHALKDLTGATAQTLTFHATVGGKLTEEQKATISAKNWTLVY